MNILKILAVLLALTCLPALPLPAQAPAAAPSAGMRAIAAALRSGPNDLNVSDLPKMSKEAAAAFDPKGMETYQIPLPTSGADFFSYAVYYDKAQAKYWVRRTGGFAGVNELYGPCTPPSTPK